MLLEYGHNQISLTGLFEYFELVSDDYNPPLRTITDLSTYVAKIKRQGETFEVWCSGHLVGIVAGYFNAPDLDFAFITQVHIRKDIRQNGIGANLMQMAIAHAKQLGFRKLTLKVNHDNEQAIRFYKKLGFAVSQSDESQKEMVLLLETQ